MSFASRKDDRSLLEFDQLDLPASQNPAIGRDVLCLALLVPSGCTVQTNLDAPIVINLHNGRGVQAVLRSGYRFEAPQPGWRLGSRMLVLRRRVGDIILVGGEVEIEVIEISRTRVKLGVRAPLHVPVIRKETLPIVRENQLASDLMAVGGTDHVGELLKLLRPVDPPPAPVVVPSAVPDVAPAVTIVADTSTKPPAGRYETPERYSGYRGNRENPHPA